MHSALGFINTIDMKIWTAEDPVEITQAGLRQVQVNANIGFTFANAMRAFLRADPDVIMVGEIRDPETARMRFKRRSRATGTLHAAHQQRSRDRDAARRHGNPSFQLR